MRELRSQPLGLTIAVAVAAMLLAACGKEKADPAPVRPVQTMVVGRYVETAGATYSGQVQAQYSSQQGFQVAGIVAKRITEVGDRVAVGAPLLQLDLSNLQYNLQQAKAQLDAARSQAAQAKVNLGRSKALVDQNFISQTEYDQSEVDYQTALAQQQAAQAQYGEAENALGYGTLRAAVPGIVTSINVDVGQVVQAGEDAVDIAQNGDREVVISVPESRVYQVRHARDLTASLWAIPDVTYKARLRVLYPDVNQSTRTYDGHVTLLNPDATVRLGMTAYVHVPGTVAHRAYRVPLTALYNRDGASLLWVMNAKDSTVSARSVKICALQGDSALISSGIAPGDVIVTAGAQLLHAGQKVNPVGTYFPQSQ
ncbi:MAG TPA: efflux RND transporter periplasmic adaptor subunit [Gammaproteobacteria bacterium]|nr:efflux RND transporter periplasmic adaptor subunit [Gammaproteobacteria bacterium]